VNVKRVHKVRPATLDEMQTIVNELPPRYKLMALLGAWCALRYGELAELRRGDIDLGTGRVKIRRAVVRANRAADRDAETARRLSERAGG
jgi:integrase